MFQVRVLSRQARDHTILCHLAGRMRVHRVRILPGDRVKLEMTPYDLQKGRITYRFRNDQQLPIDDAGNLRVETNTPEPSDSVPS